MRKSRKIIHEAAPVFAFVVDGDTEVWYLQMLKRNEHSLRLKIVPEIPQRKTIKEQFDRVVNLSESEYTRVFWIVDMDTLIKEFKERVKGKSTSLQTFINCKKIIEKKYKNVTIIANNPCLEYWFLLHFEKTTRLYTCAEAEVQLKQYLKDYEKSQKYFTKQDQDIYLKLKPYLKTAIEHAHNLGKFESDAPDKAVCEMYLLFWTEELKKYYDY